MNQFHAKYQGHHRPIHQEGPKTKKVKIKVQQKWFTKGEKILWTISGFCFICLSIYMVSFSSSMNQLNREVIQLENKINEQKLVNDNLQLEIKEYSRPERILEVAKEAGLKPQNGEVKQANILKR